MPVGLQKTLALELEVDEGGGSSKIIRAHLAANVLVESPSTELPTIRIVQPQGAQRGLGVLEKLRRQVRAGKDSSADQLQTKRVGSQVKRVENPFRYEKLKS